MVTGVITGSSTITYNTGTCSTSTTVTVTTQPAAIGGTSVVCAGSTTTLSDATPGGTWNSGSPSVATINSSGVVTGVTAGSATISYTLGSCFVTRTVTVNALPAAIT